MALVATLDMATLARGATEDTEDMVLATAVDTPLDTLDSATLVVTTASVRPRLSPRLMPMLRLIPTTDTVTPDLSTLDCGATEDTDSDTAVDTLPLDTPDLVTAVATTEDSAMAMAVATDTSDKKVPVLQSAKAFKTSVKQNNFS